MALDCLNKPCTTILPSSTVISLFGEPEATVNTDCSTNLIYLTDEAGLVDQTDAASDPLFTADSSTKRVKRFGSTAQLETNFTKCSRTYKELAAFFGWNAGTLLRPSSVIVVYFDSTNETMVDALSDLYTCFTCFYGVTHVAYDKDGTAIYDTADQIALAEWGLTYNTPIVLPTADHENAILASEEETNASKSKVAGHCTAIYQLLEEECIPVLDGDCAATDVEEVVYGYQHLAMAGVITSISSTSDNYVFNVKFKPIGAIKLGGVSTSHLSQADTFNVTGANPYADGVQATASHHINLYHNVAGNSFLLDGLTATGRYIDEIIHRRYIEDTLNGLLMSLLVSNQSIPMSDLSGVTGQLLLIARTFVSKGVVSDAVDALDKSTFSNIILEGNGWVLTQEATTDSNTSSRTTPRITFCYVKPGAVNYLSVGLCGSLC